MDFNETLRKFQRPILTIAWRMLGNWEEARDAAQETFIRYWQMDHKHENPEARFSLLARMVTNRCIDHLRQKRRRIFLALEWIKGRISPEDPETNLDHQNLESEIMKAADRLKPKQKAAFLLRDVEGYSIQETAEILEDSENRVCANLHLARKNMRKWLKPFLEE